MDSATTGGAGNGDAELRRRLPEQPTVPRQAASVDAARQMVVDLNNAEEEADKSDKDKRTYGRTPNGTGTPRRPACV